MAVGPLMGPGLALQTYAPWADTPRALFERLLADEVISPRWTGLTDQQFAVQMVTNALGQPDAAAIAFVVDYLKTHDRIDALSLALDYAPVKARAYGEEGLLLVGMATSVAQPFAESDPPAVPALVTREVITYDHMNELAERRDGQLVEHRTIKSYLAPIVTPQRLEDPSTLYRALADVPIAKNSNGEILLQVGIPIGVGFKADEMIAVHYPLSVRQIIDAFIEHRIDDTPLSQPLRHALDRYIAEFMPDTTQTTVRHIVFEQNELAGDTPIVITGALGQGDGDRQHPERQEVVIIDAHEWRAGTKLVLNHIELAIVFGDVTIELGQGTTTVLSDQGNQTVIAGPGNARIGVGAGQNSIDGGAGVDTWLYDQPGVVGVYLAQGSAKTGMAPYTVLINHTTGEQTSFQNVERAEAYGQIYDLTSLQQPVAQLERLALLSKVLFNRAPGLDFLRDWQPSASEPSTLVERVLASAEAAPLAEMSDEAFARWVVHNALGDHPQAVQFAENYLQQHGRSELILLGIQHDAVIDAVTTQYGLPLL